MARRRIVIALGGNALLRRGEPPDASVQHDHIAEAAPALAAVADRDRVVVVHGNGPQVGLLAAESSADRSLTRPYPLDVLGAQTQGMVGYWIQQALVNAGLRGPVVTVVTQTVVDPADPELARPSKFVGAMVSREQSVAIASERGWTFGRDGAGWRRVVPSPLPVRLVEAPTIEHLLGSGTTVVCAGGGGVPVVESPEGLRGVEAVVDKDAAAALLAIELDADLLVMLTDVAGVMTRFGTSRQRLVRLTTPSELAAMDLPRGSMRPKAEAAAEFVLATGRSALIGGLGELEAVLDGRAGTEVVPPGVA